MGHTRIQQTHLISLIFLSHLQPKPVKVTALNSSLLLLWRVTSQKNQSPSHLSRTTLQEELLLIRIFQIPIIKPMLNQNLHHRLNTLHTSLFGCQHRNRIFYLLTDLEPDALEESL